MHVLSQDKTAPLFRPLGRMPTPPPTTQRSEQRSGRWVVVAGDVERATGGSTTTSSIEQRHSAPYRIVSGHGMLHNCSCPIAEHSRTMALIGLYYYGLWIMASTCMSTYWVRMVVMLLTMLFPLLSAGCPASERHGGPSAPPHPPISWEAEPRRSLPIGLWQCKTRPPTSWWGKPFFSVFYLKRWSG